MLTGRLPSRCNPLIFVFTVPLSNLSNLSNSLSLDQQSRSTHTSTAILIYHWHLLDTNWLMPEHFRGLCPYLLVVTPGRFCSSCLLAASFACLFVIYLFFLPTCRIFTAFCTSKKRRRKRALNAILMGISGEQPCWFNFWFSFWPTIASPFERTF